jgi:hypothetical protein
MSPIIFAYEAVACDGGWVVMETDDCDPHPNTKVVSEVFATREEAEASALRMTATHEADATTAERRPCTQQRSALAHRSSPSSIDGSGGRVGCGQAVIRASERFWRFWRGRDSQPCISVSSCADSLHNAGPRHRLADPPLTGSSSAAGSLRRRP